MRNRYHGHLNWWSRLNIRIGRLPKYVTFRPVWPEPPVSVRELIYVWRQAEIRAEQRRPGTGWVY